MGKILAELLEEIEAWIAADTEVSNAPAYVLAARHRVLKRIRAEFAKEKAGERVVEVIEVKEDRSGLSHLLPYHSPGTYAVSRLPDPKPKVKPETYALADCWAYRCPACGAYTISGLAYPPECERCHEPWGEPIR